MWRSIFVFLRNFVLLVALFGLISPEWPLFSDEGYQVWARVGTQQFDFASWAAGAVGVKREAEFSGVANHIEDDESRAAVVLDFIDLLGEVQRLERQLNQVFSDPNIDDPEEASADLQAEIAFKREQLSQMQPIAEAIVQNQVTAVLLEEEFGAGGRLYPPVRMHMTPLPAMLIVSPRDEIGTVYSYALKNGFSTPDRVALEETVYEDLDLSAYVTNIGGLAFYPTMIVETTNLNFLVDVVAHEWSHIWFALRPIGLNYGLDRNVRTINESAAGIIGEEVGAEVIRRHYPEFAPLPPAPQPDSPVPTPTPDPNLPPPFNFRAEMAETRIQADQLLGEGKIDEAEAYMEERRIMFVANGYNLRVLNQAYFAFHGSYAEQGGGAAGRDPVGPLVTQIREASPSLKSFMETIGGVGSYEDLLAIAAELNIDVSDE